jgi:hypothetical protein
LKIDKEISVPFYDNADKIGNFNFLGSAKKSGFLPQKMSIILDFREKLFFLEKLFLLGSIDRTPVCGCGSAAIAAAAAARGQVAGDFQKFQ